LILLGLANLVLFAPTCLYEASETLVNNDARVSGNDVRQILNKINNNNYITKIYKAKQIIMIMII